MNIDTFIKLYNTKRTDDDKANAIAQIMKPNHHVSYTDKVDRVRMIAETSYHEKQEDINGAERIVFHQNSAVKYMLYSLTLVNLYTNIDVDFKECVDIFEKINGEILDGIISTINERELKEFQMLLEFACDDLLVNEYETHAFISGQVVRFCDMISVVGRPFFDKIDVNRIINLIENNLKQAR